MKKDAVRGNPVRSAAQHRPISAHRKSEAVLRLMSGEREDDVAHSVGCTLADLELWRHEFVVAGERRMGEMPLGWLERITSPFERLVPLATLVSVAIGVMLFVQSQQKERASRDRDTARAAELRVTESFNALDDKYIEYVKLCLQHPDLDVFDTPLVRAAPPTPAQLRQEQMLFAILFSLLERSYLMYRDHTDAFKQQEWDGWQSYIRSWLPRKNFLEEWSRTKKEFDAAFVKYLDEMIAQKAGTD